MTDATELPGVNVVAICPNTKAQNALIRAIQETGNIKPAMKSSSVSARRTHYAVAKTKLIINTASDAMHELLGKHSVALAVEVADRVAAANRAKEIFNEEGFEAAVHTHAEPEFPDGFLTFVSVPALEGITLLFWPRNEDVTPDLVSQLPKREPWSDEDLKS